MPAVGVTFSGSPIPCWVVFSDLRMPGTDGLELCRTIRREWPMTTLFATTGFATLFELADCREAGFEDYFLKPLDRPLVLAAAKHAFERMARWTRKK
jgi:CheY-like chemotaxis protein